MRRLVGPTVIAALLASTASGAQVLQLTCRGAVGDHPGDFTVEVDLESSGRSEEDLRWSDTHDGATIDWHLDRRNGELRGVVLTGPDAGVLIAGKCNRGS